MKSKVFKVYKYLCLTLLLSGLIQPPAWAADAESLQNKFIMTTDISVYGNYLTLAPEDGAEYKLEAQWPVEQKYQWRKFLENLELLPKIEKLRNPVVEKDPEVIIFVQNNPDQISGEDIYLSADSNILRISRLAVDTLYLDKNKNFYKFLKMQADKNDAAYSKSENDKTKEKFVFIQLENSLLLIEITSFYNSISM